MNWAFTRSLNPQVPGSSPGRPTRFSPFHHVAGCNKPLWATKPTTAKRVRQRVSAVMAWVIAEGHRGDDPAGSAITMALPMTNGPRKISHLFLTVRPPYRCGGSVRRRGIRRPGWRQSFAILTAVRSGEVRGARWTEIDQQTGVMGHSGRTDEGRS